MDMDIFKEDLQQLESAPKMDANWEVHHEFLVSAKQLDFFSDFFHQCAYDLGLWGGGCETLGTFYGAAL